MSGTLFRISHQSSGSSAAVQLRRRLGAQSCSFFRIDWTPQAIVLCDRDDDAQWLVALSFFGRDLV